MQPIHTSQPHNPGIPHPPSPASYQQHSPETPGFFARSKTLLVVSAVVVSTVAAYGLYLKFKQKSPVEQDTKGGLESSAPEMSSKRAKAFIKREIQRLKDPKIRDQYGHNGTGYLERQDFFDLLLIIQLKAKLKLQKDIGRNQRDRAKLLKVALDQNNFRTRQGEQHDHQYFEAYQNRSLEIINGDFEQYEEQFQQILQLIGITSDTWESSKELYLRSNEQSRDGTGGNIETEMIEKRIFEYLPQPHIPRSFTRERAKEVVLDVNQRASQIFKTYMQPLLSQSVPYECEPILMEVLAYDLAFIEYSIAESVIRLAIQTYQLFKDPDIQEQMEEYLSS